MKAAYIVTGFKPKSEMNTLTYFALLISGLAFVGCFWHILIAILKCGVPKKNYPKAKHINNQ